MVINRKLSFSSEYNSQQQFSLLCFNLALNLFPSTCDQRESSQYNSSNIFLGKKLTKRKIHKKDTYHFINIFFDITTNSWS